MNAATSTTSATATMSGSPSAATSSSSSSGGGTTLPAWISDPQAINVLEVIVRFRSTANVLLLYVSIADLLLSIGLALGELSVFLLPSSSIAHLILTVHNPPPSPLLAPLSYSGSSTYPVPPRSPFDLSVFCLSTPDPCHAHVCVSLKGPLAGQAFCNFQGLLITFALAAVVMWNFFMALHCLLVVTSKRPAASLQRYHLYYHVVTWSVATVSASVGYNLHAIFGKGPSFSSVLTYCWINSDYADWRLILYYGPLSVSFFVNLGMYLAVVRSLKKTQLEISQMAQSDGGVLESVHKGVVNFTRRTFVYVAIFCVCWIIPTATRFHDAVDPTNPIYTLLIFHAITSPSNGFFNAIAFFYFALSANPNNTTTTNTSGGSGNKSMHGGLGLGGGSSARGSTYLLPQYPYSSAPNGPSSSSASSSSSSSYPSPPAGVIAFRSSNSGSPPSAAGVSGGYGAPDPYTNQQHLAAAAGRRRESQSSTAPLPAAAASAGQAPSSSASSMGGGADTPSMGWATLGGGVGGGSGSVGGGGGGWGDGAANVVGRRSSQGTLGGGSSGAGSAAAAAPPPALPAARYPPIYSGPTSADAFESPVSPVTRRAGYPLYGGSGGGGNSSSGGFGAGGAGAPRISTSAAGVSSAAAVPFFPQPTPPVAGSAGAGSGAGYGSAAGSATGYASGGGGRGVGAGASVFAAYEAPRSPPQQHARSASPGRALTSSGVLPVAVAPPSLPGAGGGGGGAGGAASSNGSGVRVRRRWTIAGDVVVLVAFAGAVVAVNTRARRIRTGCRQRRKTVGTSN
ncbi:hypothetical protein DFJ73DRAFT_921494 [Zopfochytrium polystomum]|nr:hypothetical protein DFJ73DRAFT_921494 [Zopfochytrium polystomum]